MKFQCGAVASRMRMIQMQSTIFPRSGNCCSKARMQRLRISCRHILFAREKVLARAMVLTSNMVATRRWEIFLLIGRKVIYRYKIIEEYFGWTALLQLLPGKERALPIRKKLWYLHHRR